MDTQRFRTYRIIAFDVLLTLFCVGNMPSVVDRAHLPIVSALQESRTVITEVEPLPGVALLFPGDVLLAWNGIRIIRPEHVEFLGDRSHIGETVSITVDRDGTVLTVPATLVAFSASLRFALVYAITGIVVFVLAMFLVVKRPSDTSALALHRALVALGALILLTQGALDVNDPVSYIRRAGLFAAYALTAAWFLSWTLQFPVRWIGERRWPGMVLTGIALMFAAILSSTHLSAMLEGAPSWFDAFQDVYEWFHLYFAVFILSGLFVLGAGYVLETDSDRRRALRWVLWGMLLGTAPFTLFVVLPQAFGPEFYLMEEIAASFALAIPVSLTVAFLRYHVFDVQVDAHRQLASRLLNIMTGSLAILASLVVVSLLWEDLVFDDHFEMAMSIAIMMLLLQPARSYLRRLFEESLHPVRGAMLQLLQRAEERFRDTMSPDKLGDALLLEFSSAIPGFTFHWSRVETGGVVSLPSSSGSEPVITTLPDDVRRALSPHSIVERGRPSRKRADSEQNDVQHWMAGGSIDLAVGIHDESDNLLGLIVGRQEPRRDSVSSDERQAIRALAALASESLARLHLQERVFIEQQERRRSDELNRLKSRFVSSVSHDLRTPLTSIKMFAEMLQDPRLPADRRQEYADIISRESQRLGRMVNNVLDFARIERGAREYVLTPTDPRRILEASVEAMRAHAESLDGSLILKAPKRLPLILGDADALQDVMHNLVGNALKYSKGHRRILLEAEVDGRDVVIRVRDNGIGIAPEHVQKIFDPFFRVKDERAAQTGGAGLGLAIVKHTIDAHGGSIRVDSVVGKGTTVSIRLPRGDN